MDSVAKHIKAVKSLILVKQSERHVDNSRVIFQWCAVRCRCKNRRPKKNALTRDWTACSKHVDHYRFNSQHNLEGPILPFNVVENVHFDNKKIRY